jgi:putative membrane protein
VRRTQSWDDMASSTNTGGQIADSARKMVRSTERVEDSADRRTQLAADRTVFAAERTYAAWVRTGLMALASGIGARTLLAGLVPAWLATATASMLVLFSAFCFGAGIWRHLNPGAPPPDPDTRQLPPVLLVALNGFLAMVALAALLGIWVGPDG